MINYCSQCGFKIEESHKFCPNCGNKISVLKSDGKSASDDKLVDRTQARVIVCDNCGEENAANNKICSGCGVPLTGEEKISSAKDKNISQDKSQSQKIKADNNLTHSATVNTKSKQTEDISDDKIIDNKKIILIGSITGLIVLVILFTSGIFDSGSEIEKINQDVKSGVDLNNLNAINDLEEKVKANPDDLESVLHLAHLQNDSRLYEKAIENYKKYLAVKPADADARVDMGICYYNLADYPTAISEMEKAIEYQPDHQIAHLNLGIVNLTAGNLDKSKEWFRKVIELDPETDIAKRAQELLNSH